jgi:nucleoid DNA-binding protein
MRGKVMQSLTKSEFERLVALKSHKYKKDVSVILDAYYSVLKEVILTGYEISIPGIGVFANKQIEAKPEREKMNYFTKEYYTLPAQDAFNKPTFKFRPALSKAMKERTLGKVF